MLGHDGGPEPSPMWILCTVAAVSCDVDVNQWSEQTLSVPNGAEYVSLINQHNLEEATVL